MGDNTSSAVRAKREYSYGPSRERCIQQVLNSILSGRCSIACATCEFLSPFLDLGSKFGPHPRIGSGIWNPFRPAVHVALLAEPFSMTFATCRMYDKGKLQLENFRGRLRAGTHHFPPSGADFHIAAVRGCLPKARLPIPKPSLTIRPALC